jgi:hypothetical protein
VSTWILLQIVLNILLLTSSVILWLRMKRPPQDDPRLSRGLQLLQSKITVLEDLSDRTDRQVTQLTNLIDQKTRLLQSKIYDAETQIMKVQGAMDKSLEVAEIFQDKIPHDEIIDRQNTVKYVRAARMANAGRSVEDILQEVDLPREQVEFIAKVNRDKLMFDDTQLPPWAKEKANLENFEFDLSDEELVEEESHIVAEQRIRTQAASLAIDPSAFELPKKDYESLKQLGDEFRQACKTHESREAALNPGLESPTSTSREVESQIYSAAKIMTKKIVDGVSELIPEPFPQEKKPMKAANTAQTKVGTKENPVIRKVVFPRIDIDKY